MTKEELIERIKKLPCFEGPIADTVTVNREWILESIKELDEPQKVTIPQFVADLIEEARTYEWDLDDLFEHISEYSGDSEVSIWFFTLGNIDVLARAWLDGYTVKEKRYLVKMKGEVSEGFFIYGLISKKYFFSSDSRKSKCRRLTHTRKDLENAGLGWVFDCEGVEVEEVEE